MVLGCVSVLAASWVSVNNLPSPSEPLPPNPPLAHRRRGFNVGPMQRGVGAGAGTFLATEVLTLRKAPLVAFRKEGHPDVAFYLFPFAVPLCAVVT